MHHDKKNKIYLLGFMGSGKSTLGKKIARALDYRFSDLDHYIESVEGRSIPDIFKEEGEDYFRKRETECLKDFSKQSFYVVATGGGTPCYDSNMELMLNEGCCVYLQYNETTLFQRLHQSVNKRPLLAGKSDEELKHFISEKLKEREKYYLRSHLVIDGLHVSLQSLTTLLKNKVLSRAL